MYKHNHMAINHHQIHHQMHNTKHLCGSDKIIVSVLILCSLARGICIGMYLGEK